MNPSMRAMADLATPMAIRVAATLGLVELTGPTGARAQHLAERTGASGPALECLLEHLVSVGVFEREDGGRYRATELGRQMHTDAPEGIKPLLDINSAGGRADLAFVELLSTITTGAPACPVRYVHDFWTDLHQHPRLRNSFDAQMNWRFRDQVHQIATGVNWSRFARLCDIGGGNGFVLEEVLRCHPTVHGQVLELAPTAEAAAERFATSDLAARAEVIEGSFFDALPGTDAYLLCDILHDWDTSTLNRSSPPAPTRTPP